MAKPIETLNPADELILKEAIRDPFDALLGETARPSLNERNTRALLRFRDGLGRMSGVPNTKNCRIAIVGDSRAMGHAGGFSNTSSVINSWPWYLKEMFRSGGIDATMEAFIGTHSVPLVFGVTGFDSRIAADGWGYGDALTGNSAGGRMLNSQVAGGVLSITPTIPFDTVEVLYAGGGSGTFSVSVDGVSTAHAGNALGLKTVSWDASYLEFLAGAENPIMTCSGFSGILRKRSVPGALPAPLQSTIRLTTLTTNINCVGVIAFNSTKRVAQFLPMGWSGSSTEDWVNMTNSYGPMAIFENLRPALTIIDLGTNDLYEFQSPATFTANMTQIITQAKLYGSVALVVPYYTKPDMLAPNPLLPYATKQDPFMNAIRGLAVSQGCALFDCQRRWGTYDQIGNNATTIGTSPPGWYVDGLHAYSPGQMDYARGLRDVLLRS